MFANLLFIAVPLPLPLSAILIVLTDLGFEMFMALSYALDPPESRNGLMKLQPRKPVNSESQQILKENETYTSLSSLDKIKHSIKNQSSNGEVLVDGALLKWSYLEAGTIEALGCFACYFFAIWYHYNVTPAELVKYGGEWSQLENLVIPGHPNLLVKCN